jgi:exosome complex component RRP4
MESKAHVQDRDVVAPGMVLATGMDYLPSKGTYRQGDNIIANRLGLVQLDGKVIKTVPLAGRYMPRKDDIVIGRVTDVLLNGWRIEINSPYESVLTLKDASSDFIQRGADLTRYYEIGDSVVCQIAQVTSQNLVDVSMRGPSLRKLIGGTRIQVNPQKTPRIIGKRASMIGMIKRATDCNIVVGQNGRIWMNGEPAMEVIATQAIRMIEANSHRSGLTDRIKAFLKEKTGRDVQPTDDTELGSPQQESAPSVIRSQVRRDESQMGGFRKSGFRRGNDGGGRGRGNFRNTNNDGAEANNAPNTDGSDGGAQ